MKKLLFSLLLCLGVGLTLMAGPAPMGDNTNPQRKGDVTVVPQRTDMPRQHARPYLKHEVKVKKIDVTNLPAPKLTQQRKPVTIIGRPSFDFGERTGVFEIIKDPVPFDPGKGRPNGGGGFVTRDDLLIIPPRSGNNNFFDR